VETECSGPVTFCYPLPTACPAEPTQCPDASGACPGPGVTSELISSDTSGSEAGKPQASAAFRRAQRKCVAIDAICPIEVGGGSLK